MRGFVLIFLSISALAACSAREPGAAPGEEHGEDPSHWTYDDQARWDETSHDARVCAVGARQSPIALLSEDLVDQPDIDFSYAPAMSKVSNNGHAILIEPPSGQTLSIGGATYEWLQAHLHVPSEHRLDTATFAMEMHFVHKNAENGLAVLGVLIREGAEHPAFGQIISATPREIGKEHALDLLFDPEAFLPADRVHFRYEGSLTTPPCTEGVLWHVLRTPIEASTAQVSAIRAAMGENARALQGLGVRDVSVGE